MTENNGLLSDGYYFYLLRFLLSKPSLQKKFHKIYVTDRYRFYSAAKQRKIYASDVIATDLAGQVSFREDLGVLCVASSDDVIFQRVYNILIDSHPKMKALLSHPNDKESLDFIFEDMRNALTTRDSSFLLFPLSFLLYHGSYDVAQSDSVYLLASALSAEVEKSFRTLDLNKHQGIVDKDLDIEKGSYSFSREDWEIIRKLRYPLFIDKLTDLSEARDKNSAEVLSIPDGLGESTLLPALDMISSYSDGKEKDLLIATASSLCYLLAKSNVVFKDIAGERALTKEEQAHVLMACSEWKNKSDNFRPHDFLIATVVYCLGKEIMKMKDMYWANNAESVLMELEEAKQKAEDLSLAADLMDKEKRALLVQNRQLEDQVRRLEREAATDFREAVKPYADQVSALERENEKLHSQITKADSILEELESLRLLVFGDEQDADIVDLPPLQEMLAVHRVVIIGGHINLQNKLMERYPNLTIVDGVSPTFDLQSLDAADLVVFYVYHMSHKVYQRAITYLRQKKKPFAYLPRITNMEIFDENLQRMIYEKCGG